MPCLPVPALPIALAAPSGPCCVAPITSITEEWRFDVSVETDGVNLRQNANWGANTWLERGLLYYCGGVGSIHLFGPIGIIAFPAFTYQNTFKRGQAVTAGDLGASEVATMILEVGNYPGNNAVYTFSPTLRVYKRDSISDPWVLQSTTTKTNIGISRTHIPWVGPPAYPPCPTPGNTWFGATGEWFRVSVPFGTVT